MSETRRQPQRTCLGCRQVLDQKSLIRFVRAPGGQLLVDLRNRLPGRGAYTCWTRNCLEQAVRRQAFNRSFKQGCEVGDFETLVSQVLSSLRDHMASLIGMARKSAQVVAGGNQVLDELSGSESFGVLIIARDLSENLETKIRSRAGMVEVACDNLFTKAEIGNILGRTEHSAVGLYTGQLADAFKVDLLNYRHMSGEN